MPGTRSTPAALRERREKTQRLQKEARKPRVKKGAFARAVNSLTNRERSRWARAGYPGLHAKDGESALRVLAYHN